MMPRNSRVQPNTQLSSRGLRKAPVKNTRIMCTSMPVTKTSAAQWWICRISSPPRTSKLMSSVDS
ncbi:hypothetical protein M2164_006362 [Streptomyces sp. SAI-208]|nr:hypothetical protein [Streptomyces sp. SAI-208]